MTNNFLVLIPFNLPWEWSTDYTNQTAYELVKKGNTVICYMWSETFSLWEYVRMKKIPKIFVRKRKNLFIYHPILFIPFRRFRIISKINEKIDLLIFKLFIWVINLRKKFKQKIVWIFDPRLEPLIKRFSTNWKIIFDCVDFFPGSTSNIKDRRDLLKKEKKLVKNSDLVVANSRVLQEYLAKLGKKIELVPQGFRIESFRNSKQVKKIKRNGRPLIGYIGAINYRIDFKLLYDLAKNNPKWDFALWGHVLEKDLFTLSKLVDYKKLIKLPNVITGVSDKNHISGIIKQFDVGIIPYDMSLDFNKYSYPMKVFEYFYLGKPVVSTNIIELKQFPDTINIGKNSVEWQIIIKRIISQKWTYKNKYSQRKAAIENSWKNKVGQILNYLNEND